MENNERKRSSSNHKRFSLNIAESKDGAENSKCKIDNQEFEEVTSEYSNLFPPMPEEKNTTDDCNIYSSKEFCELIKNVLMTETEETFEEVPSRIDVTGLPTKQYLEETVLPILLQALQYLAITRPPEPINALCIYLLKYRDTFEKVCYTEPPEEASMEDASSNAED